MRPCAFPFCAQLLHDLFFECCDAHVGGVELAAQQLGVVEGGLGLECERLECGDLLAEVVDFGGPAGLVNLFAVVSELDGFAEGLQLALESVNGATTNRTTN